jgi:hypothetical protein
MVRSAKPLLPAGRKIFTPKKSNGSSEEDFSASVSKPLDAIADLYSGPLPAASWPLN